MSLKRKQRKTLTTAEPEQSRFPQLTLSQALDLAISAKRIEGLRERTLTDYVKMWGYLTEWLAKNYPEIETVDQLDADIFRNYISYLRFDAKRYEGHNSIDFSKQETGLKETTINIRLRAYNSLFNHLVRENLLATNPMGNVKLLRHDIDLTNGFTDDEVKRLLSQPNQRDYVGFRDFVMMNMLIDTGMRISELLSLRANDLDFTTRFITLQGERNKNRKPRLVPFSPHLSKLLLQLVAENKEHFKTDRLFLSCYGEPLGANHFNKRLKHYAELAGIEGKKVGAHVYRHYWTKTMAKNGCDVFTLQKLGGWADIRTMRRYVQIEDEELRQSHDDFTPINMHQRVKPAKRPLR